MEFKKQKDLRVTLAIRLPQKALDLLPKKGRGKFIEQLILKNNGVVK